MSSYGWAEFAGATIDAGYHLETLIRAELKSAAYLARSTDDRDPREFLLIAMRLPPDEAQACVKRLLEAKFLHHPNLMAVFDAGQTRIGDWDVVFAAMEPAVTSLQSEEIISGEGIWNLCRDVVQALAALHAEDLIYCSLRPESIWRVRNVWKLGDYTQLRLNGKGRTAETRALMGRMPEVPPEAYEGVVTPGWDVWAFGVTLARVLRRTGERISAPLPDPFDAIVNRCLDPEPAARITLNELAGIFAQGYLSEPQPYAPPQPQAAAAAGMPVPSASAPLPDPSNELPARPERRRRSWLLFGIAGAVVTTGFGIFALRHPLMTNITNAAPLAAVESSRQDPPPPVHPAVKPGDQEVDRMDTGTPEERIRRLLTRWVESTRSRNVDQLINCYAPLIEAFNDQRNVTSEQVRDEKTRQFADAPAIRKFSVSDIRIQNPNRSSAIVTFRKDWDFVNSAGSERSELVIRPIEGRWRITSEKSKKVYWVRRHTQRG